MTKLKTLDLRETPLTDAGLKNIAPLASLKRLELWNTHITDAGMVHLRGLKNLTFLNLMGTGHRRRRPGKPRRAHPSHRLEPGRLQAGERRRTGAFGGTEEPQDADAAEHRRQRGGTEEVSRGRPRLSSRDRRHRRRRGLRATTARLPCITHPPLMSMAAAAPCGTWPWRPGLITRRSVGA